MQSRLSIRRPGGSATSLRGFEHTESPTSLDMKTLYFWLRWAGLLPVVAAVYAAVQVIGILVGVRYLHDWITEDAPGTYEVTSHFFWDWVVRPLAFMWIGAASASSALKLA